MIVPVRSHYALVLAWTGRVDAARKEMQALQQYACLPEQTEMLAVRAAAIEEIASGKVRLIKQQPPPGALAKIYGQPLEAPRKLGRNQPCWCRSGLKFKRCHGH